MKHKHKHKLFSCIFQKGDSFHTVVIAAYSFSDAARSSSRYMASIPFGGGYSLYQITLANF